ncbi:putative transporter MCH4 [Cercospora beticola]|uniref:Putative transporter MCH4 n=1 Tax=Cercospora beticola TaxID=122368 RepID=A0A2G5IE37_CERBT|nr:putative transporter MCH4 [Cercospora beticola]PIB02922.1 putative transporter MCH4 [Cercospora beticola]WPB04171.1 hypothetical protein RHO25_008816 [Cercospora beticola]CAK1357027.1 unnamed protein product [Cercospora beticola]
MSKPHEPYDQAEKGERDLTSTAGSGESFSSHDDFDRIEQHEEASLQDPDEIRSTKLSTTRASHDLRRTASNVLAKVASRLTTHSIVDPPPPPDGGLHAWTQVAMGAICAMTTWGLVNSYGAFQSYYTLNLGLPASTVSWIGSVQNFLTFFIGVFSGRALDAGFFMPALIIGATVQVLGIFLTSLSTQYWQLMLTQGIMTGLGGGIFFTPAMGLIGTYFSGRRALAMGMASAGNSVGGIIYPVLVQQLLPKLGFAWTARVLGFLNLGLLIIVMIFMRPRLPPRRSGPIVDLSAFKEPTYVFLTACCFFIIWAIYFTLYYISSYAIEVAGVSFTSALNLTIIINGVGLPARIIPSFFADRFGQLNTQVPILLVLTVVAFSWIAVRDNTGLYIFTVIYGIVCAAFQGLVPSTVASITLEMNKFGTRLGMAFGILSFAALTGPSIGGALQGAMDGSYLGAQLWSAIATGAAFGLLTTARMLQAKGRLHAKC